MLNFKDTGLCISTYVAAALKKARVWRGEMMCGWRIGVVSLC
jgi:hypothetical protein